MWVFAVKMVGEDGTTVKLMKCAVLDCVAPVFAVRVFYGWLMLGEESGVRVFALRPLVKGRVVERRRGGIVRLSNGGLEGGKRLSLPNGVNHGIRRNNEGEGTVEMCSSNEHCDSGMVLLPVLCVDLFCI